MDIDVAVVGSGHNGLVCAAYLARRGYRVEVFERRDTIGGAVCTEEMFGGYQLDVGGSAHFMIHHTPIVSDLDLGKYGLEYIPMDPFMAAPFEDGSVIEFFRDLDRTCESIAAVSPADADAYRRFVEYWRPFNEAVFEAFLKAPTPGAFAKSFFGRRVTARDASKKELARDLLKSYGRIVSERFQDDRLRAALAWWGAQSGPPPIDAASAEFVGWHSVIHTHGPARPRGGSGMLTKALARCIEDHGGAVHANSEVRRILVERERAAGVELVSGERVSARRVVSNAHIWVTFRDLLAEWTPPELRARVDQVQVGNGFGMVLRCAAESLPRYLCPDTPAQRALNGLQLLCPSTQYLNDAYADYLRELPAQDPALIAMTFSAIDDSLAPPNKHTLFLWGQYYPYNLRNGTHWDEIAEREADKMLAVLDRFAPGASKAVTNRYIQSPEEIRRKHNMPSANVMHAEMLIDQMFMFRPLPELSRYSTPLPGLFLANAAMHPGGGIYGAPGYNCSREVSRSFRGPLGIGRRP